MGMNNACSGARVKRSGDGEPLADRVSAEDISRANPINPTSINPKLY